MPFVRRQRKYYKDGVEVPESSITDFGSYKYFKNVVTTKYWKEITTGGRELGYYCYYSSDFITIGYYYASSDLSKLYKSRGSSYSPPQVSSPSELEEIPREEVLIGVFSWKNLTEDSVAIHSMSGNYATATRNTAGDLYIDTTVTETVEGTPEDYTYTTEEITPVEVTADDDYDYTEFVPSTQYDYHVDNNKIYTPTRRRREYYKYGTEINTGVTGTFARIDKGVARGFSGSNYLTLPMDFNPLSSPWSITTAIHFVDGSSGQRIFGSKGNIYGLALQTHTSTKTLHLYGSSNGSSWNLMSDLRGVTPLVDGTDYWVKMEYSGSQYIVSLSTNGVDWNDEITVNNATPLYAFKTFYIGSNAVETFLFGSIDLSQSYIKINDELWWSGDNYTKVGSWIDDGVVNGFTTANYLTTPKVFNPLGDEVECVFKINLAALDRSNPMISQGANVQFSKFFFVVMKDGRIRFNAGTGSTTIVRVDSNVVLEINKDYWLKLHIKDNVYSLYYSLDGVDYIFDNSVEDTDIIREMTTTAYIGANRDPAAGSSSYFNGSIDLRESYIKINGEDWWHGTKIVKSTEDDYEWSEDRNVAYGLVYKPYEVISQTFNVSDELQTYVVPEGVSKVNVACVASRGGNIGGAGGSVKCDLSVTEGQTLYVMVGGIPTDYNVAVYNASDIRIGGTDYENRIIIAGGGGGGKSTATQGGLGGGLIGGSGKQEGYQTQATGGTQSEGGKHSVASGGSPYELYYGKDGGYALGGNGGSRGGGAGGAGYYGGGGGGAIVLSSVGAKGSGGAGGSSYTDETLCVNVEHTQGINNGEGFVKISYIKELK